MLGPLDFGIVTIPELSNLTIAYLNSSSTSANSIIDTAKAFASIGKGCDILLTSEWPRDMHHFVDESELRDLSTNNIGLATTYTYFQTILLRSTNIRIGSGSKFSASIACALKPRYHFVGGKKCFYQRSPYRNLSTKYVVPAINYFFETMIFFVVVFLVHVHA